MLEKFKTFLRSLFSSNVNVAPESTEKEQKLDNVPEEIQEQLQEQCQHKFGPAKFVKGGGREQICKLCGYVKHID